MQRANHIGRYLSAHGLASYAEYNETPHWRSFRAQILGTNLPTCPACFAAVAVNLHHLTYQRIGAELPTDVIGLCRRCHEATHQALDAFYPGKSLEFQAERTTQVIERATGTSWPVILARWEARSTTAPIRSKRRNQPPQATPKPKRDRTKPSRRKPRPPKRLPKAKALELLTKRAEFELMMQALEPDYGIDSV